MFKIIFNCVVDKVTNQRFEKICPNLMIIEEKGRHFTRTATEIGETERERKLDIGEERMSQRKRKGQKTSTYCQS